MPSIRQSRNVNTRNYKPIPPPMQAAPTMTPVPIEDREARSPLMHSSMPLMAATGDAFQRQFYGSGNLPQHRILPVNATGGA
jgi:hypothetical protein